MVVVSLALIYLIFRCQRVSGNVFGFVIDGIRFLLLNNRFCYVGNLNNWSHWLSAAIPIMLYSLL